MRAGDLRVNPERLGTEFQVLSQISATGGGGVNRPALSPAHPVGAHMDTVLHSGGFNGALEVPASKDDLHSLKVWD
ncbi:MAG: hypothetical protein ACK2TW_04455 [Anaerolineales bacterium]